MSDSATVVIRKSKPADTDFVVSSWLRSQYFGSPYWSQMPEDLFYKHYRPLVQDILKDSLVDLAVLSDSPDTILGFLVYSNNTAHWCYTKKDYRGQGILNILLKDKNITQVSSTTLPGAGIRRKKKLTFNPFNQGPK